MCGHPPRHWPTDSRWPRSHLPKPVLPKLGLTSYFSQPLSLPLQEGEGWLPWPHMQAQPRRAAPLLPTPSQGDSVQPNAPQHPPTSPKHPWPWPGSQHHPARCKSPNSLRLNKAISCIPGVWGRCGVPLLPHTTSSTTSASPGYGATYCTL